MTSEFTWRASSLAAHLFSHSDHTPAEGLTLLPRGPRQLPSIGLGLSLRLERILCGRDQGLHISPRQTVGCVHPVVLEMPR